MPTRPQLITGEIYHVYNRGVDKREIFADDRDYRRFVHCLYEFNDSVPSTRYQSFFSPVENNKMLKERDRLVDVLCWCLMPNHFHLMLRQRQERGISWFMQKLGIGYTQAFNLRNDRSGVLFQGKFKVVHVNNDAYFLHLPFYIHANPIDLVESGWKEKGIKNIMNVTHFLENYQWSSYKDYIGKKNIPSLLDDRAFVLQDMLPVRYAGEMQQWLQEGDFVEVANF